MSRVEEGASSGSNISEGKASEGFEGRGETRDRLTLDLGQEQTDGASQGWNASLALFEAGLLARALHDPVDDADDFPDSGSPNAFEERRQRLGAGVRDVNERAKSLLDRLLNDLNELDTSQGPSSTNYIGAGDEDGDMMPPAEVDSNSLAKKVAQLEEELMVTKSEVARREGEWAHKEVQWQVKQSEWLQEAREKDTLSRQNEDLQIAVKDLRCEKRRMERLVDLLELFNLQLQEQLAKNSLTSRQRQRQTLYC